MGLGWGTFFGGIGKLLDKVPIQGRKERWKNEVDNLTKERVKLIEGRCDEKKAAQVVAIDGRLTYLNQLLKNSASD